MATYPGFGVASPETAYDMKRNLGQSISQASKDIAGTVTSAADYIGKMGVRDQLINELIGKYPEMKQYVERLKTMTNDELSQKVFMIGQLEKEKKAMEMDLPPDIVKRAAAPSTAQTAMETPGLAQLSQSVGIYKNIYDKASGFVHKDDVKAQSDIYGQLVTANPKPSELVYGITSKSGKGLTKEIEESVKLYDKEYTNAELGKIKNEIAARHDAVSAARANVNSLAQASNQVAALKKRKAEVEGDLAQLKDAAKESEEAELPSGTVALIDAKNKTINDINWNIAWWDAAQALSSKMGMEQAKAYMNRVTTSGTPAEKQQLLEMKKQALAGVLPNIATFAPPPATSTAPPPKPKSAADLF